MQRGVYTSIRKRKEAFTNDSIHLKIQSIRYFLPGISDTTFVIGGYMKQNNSNEQIYYQKGEISKEIVIQRLKERGCRITKQRQLLLDIILKEDCTSCKEMYFKANAMDSTIGVATVYRMVNLLEDIGVFSRQNMYKISCCMECNKENACRIKFEDDTFCQLSAKSWYEVISEGLKVCGYGNGKRISCVEVEPCNNK